MSKGRDLKYTLVSEGSSDAVLLPILKWLLVENGITDAIQQVWADLREMRTIKNRSLAVKIHEAIRLYPCDLLFVHRDADRAGRKARNDEIADAIARVRKSSLLIPPTLHVIPVRMQEAWLLFDEDAIRCAARNRSGTMPLELPPLRRLEFLADPKLELHNRLQQASGLSGRRLKKFSPSRNARRVSEFIDDFSPLRSLSAFAALENDVRQFVQSWANGE